VLQCVAVCCSVLQCVAVCCSVLQCVAVCCSVLQCVAVHHGIWPKAAHPPFCRYFFLCCGMLQCVAVCCSVLQYVTGFDSRLHLRLPGGFFCCDALYCSVLQCVAVRRLLRHRAITFPTLQLTATHCNTANVAFLYSLLRRRGSIFYAHIHACMSTLLSCGLKTNASVSDLNSKPLEIVSWQVCL